MPAAHRKTDVCTGHGCYPPRQNEWQSPNVLCNNLNWHRETDAWNSHCCGLLCHPSTLCAGSPNVYVNNLQAARIGDPVCCGSACATGSGNVFANG
jgi:uncharacterized Zn-binding protein involved in type VI secretion